MNRITTDQFRQAMKQFKDECREHLAFGGIDGDDNQWVDAESKTGVPLATHFVEVLNRVCAGSSRALLPVTVDQMACAIDYMDYFHKVEVIFDVPVNEPIDNREQGQWSATSVFGSAFIEVLVNCLHRVSAGDKPADDAGYSAWLANKYGGKPSK